MRDLVLSQEFRNKVYAVLGSALAILLTLGLVDAASQEVILNIANSGLDLVDNALAVVGLAIAWWKSLPSRTTTVDVAKSDVVKVVTVSGQPDVDADSNPVA